MRQQEAISRLLQQRWTWGNVTADVLKDLMLAVAEGRTSLAPQQAGEVASALLLRLSPRLDGVERMAVIESVYRTRTSSRRHRLHSSCLRMRWRGRVFFSSLECRPQAPPSSKCS